MEGASHVTFTDPATAAAEDPVKPVRNDRDTLEVTWRPWDENLARERLLRWRHRVKVSWSAHGALTSTYVKYGRQLSMCSVTLNAVVGSAIFSSIAQSDAAIYLQITAGILSMLAAVLAAWRTELNYAARAEAHRNAERGYEKIQHQFEKLHELEQSCPVAVEDGKLVMDTKWAHVMALWEALEADSPPIPNDIYNRVQREVEREKGPQSASAPSWLPSPPRRLERQMSKKGSGGFDVNILTRGKELLAAEGYSGPSSSDNV